MYIIYLSLLLNKQMSVKMCKCYFQGVTLLGWVVVNSLLGCYADKESALQMPGSLWAAREPARFSL